MIVNGFLDWADSSDRGPAGKVFAQLNSGEGIVFHSMEGGYDGSLRELMNPSRQASWMFSNRLDGTLMQHYPITASCWASGNFPANTRYWSQELEGTAATPINEVQSRTVRRLIAEWAEWSHKQPVRLGNIWEHREVWNLDPVSNAGPTACPSERYTAFWPTMLQGDDMTEEQVRALIKEMQDTGQLASTTDVLACVAQIAGSEPLTYTDTARVAAVRKALAQGRNQP